MLSLYRQGYRLEERSVGNIRNIGNFVNGSGLKNLNIEGLATCGTNTVVTGQSLTLTATASAGTAPYTYNWTVTKPGSAGTVTLPNQATNTYTFATDGQYTISVYTTDSCTTGALSSAVQTCTVTASSSVVNGPCGQPICYKCSGSSCIQDNVNGTFTTTACGTGCGTSGGVLTSMTISPTSVSVNASGTTQLTVVCKDAGGNVITCPSLTWVSSNPAIATVSSSGVVGVVTGVAIGSATITASYGTISAVSVISVTTSGATTGCTNCPSDLNYCIGGQCINKTYALYGGAAVGVLVVLMLLK
jgi:hypothetical protein